MGTKVVCGIILFFEKKAMLRSYLLNSTANPAKFHSNWAGLAVLFSRQLPNGAHNFFHIFSIGFINYFMKNPQTTFAPTFLAHIIARIDGVY